LDLRLPRHREMELHVMELQGNAAGRQRHRLLGLCRSDEVVMKGEPERGGVPRADW